MPRFLRQLLTGLAFFVFTALGALVGYVVMPLARIGARGREARIRRSQGALHLCAKIYIRFMRIIGLFTLRTPPDPPPELRERKPCVIISNHPALLDIMWLIALLPGVAFLAKAEWFGSPFISPILRLADHISGPRESEDGSPMDGAVVLDGMLDRLSRGRPVIIFPEGTRSPAGGLGPFHKGAFEAAMRAGVPLVLLRIEVDPPTLLKGQTWYDVPDRRFDVRISVLEVIQPDQFPANARQFRRDVRRRYEEALGLVSDPRPAGAEPNDAVSGVEVAAF